MKRSLVLLAVLLSSSFVSAQIDSRAYFNPAKSITPGALGIWVRDYPTLTPTPGSLTATHTVTLTPTVTHTPTVTLTATPNWVLTAIITPTVSHTQTPFAATRHNAVIATTSSEAWVDSWKCGGDSYTFTLSGTIEAAGAAYTVYGFNGPTAPSAGAANGVALFGPVTVSAADAFVVDPKYRFYAVRITVLGAATTVTLNDFCNNFNNLRQ